MGCVSVFESLVCFGTTRYLHPKQSRRHWCCCRLKAALSLGLGVSDLGFRVLPKINPLRMV